MLIKLADNIAYDPWIIKHIAAYGLSLNVVCLMDGKNASYNHLFDTAEEAQKAFETLFDAVNFENNRPISSVPCCPHKCSMYNDSPTETNKTPEVAE